MRSPHTLLFPRRAAASFNQSVQRTAGLRCGFIVSQRPAVADFCVGRHALMHTSRPSFARYLYARLGPGSRGQCLGHMFSRAFGASDFTRFWQYWNPLGGYFLGYFCYAPLRRFAPRPLCLIVTFALNGLLHDLGLLWPFGFARTERLPFPFPVFTLSLVMIAVIILAAERHRFTLAHLSLPMRVACHLLALVGPFAFSIGILLLTRI